MREHVSQSKKANTASFSIPSLKHRIPGFGLDSPQASPQAVPLVQPLHKPLTHDISRIPLHNPQAKLSISQPGDKYEQEADSVAQQVMQRIAQPVNRQSTQPLALPEGEELQMKPMANSITPLVQREEMPEDEEELQMKSLANSITPVVQRKGGEEARQDEKTLNTEQVLNRVKSRIASQSEKFELTYTQDELDSILKKGKDIGLSDKVIEDLIYTGSRKAKAIKADELIHQMEHWVNVISKRGFPEKFADLDEFQQFSQDLLKGVIAAGISKDDIRIQGSSLRKISAQDVDIAAFVDEPAFDGLLIQRYHEKITIKETNTKVSLNNKSHDELVQLANDIAANPQKYNAQGGTFQNALLNGIISSKSDIIKSLKDVRKQISAKYSHLNVEAISVLIRGGRFDVKPDLPVTGN